MDQASGVRAAHAGSENEWRLRRMQWLATSLLAAMVAVLLLAAALQTAYPWLHWVRAFAEAATVGAMADWYAVVAMFRHPLGVPVPHTAIIPKNKDRIGESLGDFVEHNFLTPENVVGRLRQFNAARGIAEWLSDRSNCHKVADAICGLIPGMLHALRDEDVNELFTRTLAEQVKGINAARIAGNVLAILTEDNRHQAVLDRVLILIEDLLATYRPTIEEKFSEAMRFTPERLDRYIVRKFLQGIIALLHEVANNPEHELRRQFDAAVQGFIDELKTSDDYRRRGEALLGDFLEHLREQRYYRDLWSAIQGRIEADIASPESSIREHLASALAVLSRGMMDQPALQEKLNSWWLGAAEKTVLRHRHQVSVLIKDVVRSWDAAEITRKLELQIGKDLQYIRVNGTLVGGAVGLLLHAAVTALGV